MTLMHLRLGNAHARPGQKAYGQLRVAEGGKNVSIPVCAIHGAKPGPHVVVLTNQHGTELNGIESVRRFCEAADPVRMRGTLCAVISSNPRAAMAGQPVWAEDDPQAEATYGGPYNMNFNWPGCTGGKLVERMTHEIWTQAVMAPHRRADVVLDLHSHQNSTAVYADDERIASLGVAAGMRNVVLTGISDKVNTLSLACHREGIPAMVVELGQQDTFCKPSILDGIVAIKNLLKFYGMLAGRPQLPKESLILDPWRDHRLANRSFKTSSYMDYVSRHDGLVVRHKDVYDTVRKGEVVCHILDAFTGRVIETCAAPITGAIYNYRIRAGTCRKNQSVFTLAMVRRISPADYVRHLSRQGLPA